LREIVSQMDGREMNFRRKRVAILLVVVCVIAVNLYPKYSETQALDPFFTLIAKGSTPTQMDILFMLKQQLAHISINLNVIAVDYSHLFLPDPDTTAVIDYDLVILDFNNNTNRMYLNDIWNDPFFAEFYSENGSIITSGYDTSLDWDEGLGTGINEWYIQTGLQMTPNNSQDRLNLCWDWQNYLMDDILPCLPLFAHKNDSSSLQLLVFNLREVRPVIGSRHPCPGFPTKSSGLGMRKAISHAINREEIRSVVLGDDYEIIHYPTNPTNKSWLNPNGVKYCHDLTAARNFMDTAGYGCGWTPGPYLSYGRWPKWEDVCAKNVITMGSPGFEVFYVAIILIILSQVILINRLKTLKEKKANEKGGA
jgi:ABC-type transport system substrate-binding protein